VVHTFCPSMTHSSPSRSGSSGQGCQIRTGSWLAEQLAPHFLIADNRGQESAPLLLGAMGEQGRRGQIQPEGIEPSRD
jgi:hypothetical protein